MLIIAFFMGLVYSVPLGPLGQIMLNKAIHKGFWHGFSMAIIGAGANLVYAFVFLMGTGSLIASPRLRIIIQAAGLIFLLYIGIKEILLPLLNNRQRKKTSSIKEVDGTDLRFTGKVLLANFVIVISYFISNPNIVAFWLNASTLINLKIIHEQTLFNYGLFGLAFAFGTLTCQYLAISVVKKARRFSFLGGIARYISFALFFVTIAYLFYLIIDNIHDMHMF